MDEQEVVLNVVKGNKPAEVDFQKKFEEHKEIYENSIVEFNDKIAKFTESKFEIEGGINTANYLLSFMENKAKWTYVESKMVIQVYLDITNEIHNIEPNGNIKLKSMDVEAINYFMQKHTEEGLETAMEFYEHCNNIVNALKPTQDFKNELEEDKREIEMNQWKMNSYSVGVEPSLESSPE